ncbi:RNA-binding domain-containing protein [Phytoactinopolyspora mesophila]|uniref:Transcriptional regulator n=1 Tax=Phytoactinopolyspora mesophila TaxID=2650750 RepID=A0A7K3MAY5_9ACTN|nr:RNA-binding domain-containing protein [Phytoactinopolyspora mesophila]NDL60416.1 transcriptional regulator [Phytoactinopolyspora mesophila]
MTPAELADVLDRLIAGWENEVVEFKVASRDYNTDKVGEYFSALSNEANLRGADTAWLVFGVEDKSRRVVGTDYRANNPERLQSLKTQITQGTEPSASVRDIHEFVHADGRVLLFEIPPAPRGIPIAWKGHYYARSGESRVPLGLDKLDTIRNQTLGSDWSAAVVPNARLDHLDTDALETARAAFAARHARIDSDEIAAWSTQTFLERAKLTVDGGITRAAILLLGKEESAHLLSPLLAEITWRLVGEERAYEHFGPPFILTSTKVYERIRNVQIRMLQPGALIQTEVEKYDRRSVLEAIHNCIAHADYTRGARIVVTERIDRIDLENAGSFVEGAPTDYVVADRTPMSYRNPFLVSAMTELNMIDRMGYGIQQIHRSQARRFLPLPDYDLSQPNGVKLTIYGAVIDQNYSELLMARTDLPLGDILALDRVQKKFPVPKETLRRLRRAHLIEGRMPHVHVSAMVAAATATKADYIRQRPQDDAHYAKLVIDYLEKFGHASRHEINTLLWDKLSDALDDQQKRHKITNLLTKLRSEGAIYNAGSKQKPRWELV